MPGAAGGPYSGTSTLALVRNLPLSSHPLLPKENFYMFLVRLSLQTRIDMLVFHHNVNP